MVLLLEKLNENFCSCGLNLFQYYNWGVQNQIFLNSTHNGFKLHNLHAYEHYTKICFCFE